MQVTFKAATKMQTGRLLRTVTLGDDQYAVVLLDRPFLSEDGQHFVSHLLVHRSRCRLLRSPGKAETEWAVLLQALPSTVRTRVLSKLGCPKPTTESIANALYRYRRCLCC